MVFEFRGGVMPEVDALNLSVACVVLVSLKAGGWIKYKLKLYPPPALRATSSLPTAGRQRSIESQYKKYIIKIILCYTILYVAV
jgi:hypothetical protein